MRYRFPITAVCVSIFCAAGFLAWDDRLIQKSEAPASERLTQALDDFVQKESPLARLDLRLLFPGEPELELVDPQFTLPRLHTWSRAVAEQFVAYAETCSEPGFAKDLDLAQHKAFLWTRFLCAPAKGLPEHFFAKPPFMHPSGKSYVSLAMKFKVNRKDEPEGVFFDLALQATIAERDSVEQVRLVRYPAEVIFDRQKNIGVWTIEAEDDGEFSFDLSSRKDSLEPVADGLYLLTLELKDGTRTDGWFLVSDLISSSSPHLRAPAVGQTLATANPEIQWDDFRSPEYKPYERRTVVIHVSQMDSVASTKWKSVWDFYRRDPTITQAVVGRSEDGSGVTALADGSYWLSLAYFEHRVFGDIKLVRCSRTGRPIFVKLEP